MSSNKIETFGNYVLLQKLATGGMAEVFLARPATVAGDGRLQVIKRILPHIANSTEFKNMFQREIQIIMGFTHAHVVQLHDFGTANGQPYIAMEYIEGKSLREINEKLKTKNSKMPVPVALSLAAQAASGLSYAHTFASKTNGKPLNAIHRDISPHNLIVSYEGNLKVIDFGIAKAATGITDLTQTGTVKGKAGYFSPEQLSGENIDARTDIFSLGVVAWELLTGERLFAKPGDSEVNVMIKVNDCEKYVVPPSRHNKDVPPDVDRIILTALQKDPAKRFRDAREFQAALRNALMKYYPAYSYSDTGQLVSVLFGQDMINERRQTNELNVRAQKMLGEISNKIMDDDKTVPMHVSVQPTRSRLASEDETASVAINLRLTKLEAALNQKASRRHYIMLAFYIFSIFGIKLGERYNYGFDFSTQKARASEMATSTATVPRALPVPQVISAVQKPVQPAQVKPQIMPPARKYASATTATKAKNVRRKKSQKQSNN